MTPLSALWLPILLSAVGVFLMSFVFHVLLPWHRGDYRPVPQEDAAMDALRQFNLPQGDYAMPRPNTMKEMGTPEFQEKMKRGPRALITILPGDMGMGKLLALWFVYILIMSLFAGYVTGRAIGPTSDTSNVLRFAATTAFLGYAAALWQIWIWYNRSLGTTFRSTVDGLVYALITGFVFSAFWPA